MAETVISKDEMSKLRSKAGEILKELENQDPSPRSWINEGRDVENDQRSKRCQYFDTHGFIKVEGFVGECKFLKQSLMDVIIVIRHDIDSHCLQIHLLF